MLRWKVGLCVMMLALAGCGPEKAETVLTVAPALVPAPASLSRADGSFAFTAGTRFVIPTDDKALGDIARQIAKKIDATVGFLPTVAPGADSKGQVTFRRAGPKGEAYDLTVTKDGIVIEAQDDAGLYYGGITLWQLVGTHHADRLMLPALRIHDEPRLKWRGAMLDVSRHFRGKQFVEHFIDWMAANKLNVFHWHLTDDQGWRLEIKKYPKLTSVGAWRVEAGAAPHADIDPKTGEPRLYGGFYTQDDVREVVAYAARRFVTVVPEIDLPGHASAAIAAYPELGVKPVGKVPADWGIYYNVYNLEPGTFRFLEGVLDEVMALFPGTFIHVGGDEVATDEWAHSDEVKARMAELGIKDVHGIQPYFTHHFADYLEAHGRRLIGWDEILAGGATEKSAIMSWRGTEGGIAAAKAHRQVVMAPAPIYYMDYRQSTLPDETPGRDAVQTLKDVYDFEPVVPTLTPEQSAAVLGAEFTVFTEHMRLAHQVEHMAFPRGFALAETVWSPPARKDFAGFVKRLMPHLARMKALGLAHPADSAFAAKIDLAEQADGKMQVTLTNQVGQGDIRYTLDGSTPTATSTLYTKPFKAATGATVKAASFNGSTPLAAPREKLLDHATLIHRFGDELKLCSADLAIKLTDDAPINGDRAAFLVDIVNPCWIYEAPDMKGVTGIDISVGNLPYNFQIGDLLGKVRLGTPQTPDGEIVVYKDACDTGEELARLPLAPATKSYGVTKLHAALKPAPDAKALCFRVAAHTYEPLWAIDQVGLTTGN